jgi:hypothetical protein
MQEKFCNFYISQVLYPFLLVRRWVALSVRNPEVTWNREPGTEREGSETVDYLFDPWWTLPQDAHGRL